MEPLFFKAENVQPDTAAGTHCRVAASMEPLFFKAENLLWVSNMAPLARLQWSRFFSKRKITLLHNRGASM